MHIRNISDNILKKEISYIVTHVKLEDLIIEEHLTPVPENKIIRTFKEDGTEDLEKQKIEPINLDSL